VTAVEGAPPRARLTAGLAAAIAEKGYAGATIADVVSRARVSKRTFYEHFADKEQCFLALYSETTDQLLELIAGAAGGDRPWDDRLEAAARAFFSALASQPALIRASMLEIQAAGPRGRELQRDVQRRYAELLMRLSDVPGVTPLTPELATAVVGGIDRLLAESARDGRVGELADAATELLRAVLTRA
jgi:AcrR family transcriptional regulator